jgi:hypothetical protein
MGWERLGRVLLGSTVAVLIAVGCHAADDGADTDGANITEGEERFGPRLFRDDFFTYLKQSKKPDGTAYSDDDVRKLVYLPTSGVMKPNVPESAAGEARLAALDKAFNDIKPSDLFKAGVDAPLTMQQDLDKVLVDGPVHIIVVPGIFGEFIPRTPFEELFSSKTIARTDWEIKGAKVTDDRFNVKALANDKAPLSDLIRVGSIDGKDASGKDVPLVTVAYLKAGIGSLEDFGTLEEDNEVYLRRLDAYFAAIGGVPKNLYLMGYSRGTATGLDLLARAIRANKPWAKSLKGFLAHAGVIYGSQLADASFGTGAATEELDILRRFVGDKDAEGELDSCPGATMEERAAFQASDAIHASNLLLKFPKFVAQFQAAALSGINLADPNHLKELKAEGIDTTLPNAARVKVFAARVLSLPLPLEGILPSESEGIVNLQGGREGYCRNVEAFKITARKIIAGAATLTTKARMDWWKAPENALPTNVRYFALTGTMGDATKDKPWEQTMNTVAYDTRSVDFRSLRGNYYDLFDASHGNQLQDSQVPVQRGRFWPELHTGATALGTPRPGFRTYFMGTVGVHHWGLAFPRAYSSRDGLEANPFPRTTLLKAIATFVAQVDRDEH